MKKVRILLSLYVLGLVGYGVLTADPEMVETLKNEKFIIWLLGLVLFYTVLTIITNAFMVFVGSIFIKLANSTSYNKENAKEQVLKYMLVTYFVHLIVSYVDLFFGGLRWISLLNIISFVFITVDVYKKQEYKSWNKKFIVMIPFGIYVLSDIVLLMVSM